MCWWNNKHFLFRLTKGMVTLYFPLCLEEEPVPRFPLKRVKRKFSPLSSRWWIDTQKLSASWTPTWRQYGSSRSRHRALTMKRESRQNFHSKLRRRSPCWLAIGSSRAPRWNSIRWIRSAGRRVSRKENAEAESVDRNVVLLLKDGPVGLSIKPLQI